MTQSGSLHSGNLLSRATDFKSEIVQSGSLRSGSLLSRATAFGSGIVKLASLHSASLLSRATDFGSRIALGVYSLGLPILDLESHLVSSKKRYRVPFNVNVV